MVMTTTSATPPRVESSHSSLPNELFIRSFSFLDQNDLFALASVNRNFLAMSSADSLWETHCHQRWKGKQNVERFHRRDVNGGENGGDRVTCCADSVRAFCHMMTLPGSSNALPALNMGPRFMHEPASWKEAYIMAEIDFRRPCMTREELLYFKWQLIYDGSPSRMGLRQFDPNGTYWSPYMGMCEWVLDGQYLMFAGMSLLVERDIKSWGWIIGRDQRTVYHSIDADRT